MVKLYSHPKDAENNCFTLEEEEGARIPGKADEAK
jgi:hypothetical protein